jgi:hypothetical protein
MAAASAKRVKYYNVAVTWFTFSVCGMGAVNVFLMAAIYAIQSNAGCQSFGLKLADPALFLHFPCTKYT